MTGKSVLELLVFVALLAAGAVPLGGYLARVARGDRHLLARVFGPIERGVYRAMGVDPAREMTWSGYATAALVFSAIGYVLLYLLLRTQGVLPLNPNALGAVAPDLAMNTAISFVTNTNWQAYGGESTMSHLSQMFGLGVQNFLSAATGLAVLVALIRGFSRERASTIGNFWADLVRGTLYVLLPLSLVLALLLVWQGVPQTARGTVSATLVEPLRIDDTTMVTTQTIAVGPVASQLAIKQLGTNGGGYYNVNSAHPLENPTPLATLLESLAILLIPAALCVTFGHLVGDRRQGWALLAVMFVIFLPLVTMTIAAESTATAALAQDGVAVNAGPDAPGGQMEGKEVRFGIAQSAIWATATTAASNGSVNAMHDSFTPIGGLIPMWLMQLGEVVFGGVGSGLYGLLAFVLIAVFVAGLLVGRTPEYLGKKVEAFEMKMASIAVLAPATVVLLAGALAVGTTAGRAGVFNSGPHGFSEVLYAVSSAANNNGSAFGGLSANSPFYNTLLGAAMIIGRFWVMVPMLAIAGAMARKARVPVGAGTLPTHGPLFVGLVVGTIVLVGALTFLPALALGPIAEQLSAR
ncbi:MAG: potassium-transporting ATPase subunit KdpA [Gemmatimonadaceae bacterium]|jgi:K+-transporting ATPase ATPase A chain|nr:potassium-transporting ATPase subunit KdpA [Gemmatimonadaceae bacterium]